MAFPHKREKITEAVRRWIAEGKYRPGDRFPSDQELARLFDVTHVTVRSALRPLVDEGLLERRIGAGTIVRAATEPRGLSLAERAVGVVFPAITHSFLAEVLRAIEESLFAVGRSLLLGMHWDLPAREETLIRGWRAQGIDHFVLSPIGGRPDFYRQLAADARVVFVDRTDPDVDVPGVSSADVRGAARLTKTLLSLGHRQVVHLAGPPRASTALARLRGFEDACAAAGVVPHVVPAGFFIEDGQRAMQEVLAAPSRPTAVVCANDPVALGAIRALEERGLAVPGHISVAGYGDSDLGRHIELTTVRQFPERLGAEAVRLLLSPAPCTAAQSVELEPEIVLRASTAPPPGDHRPGARAVAP